jgi:hypothetical protein
VGRRRQIGAVSVVSPRARDVLEIELGVRMRIVGVARHHDGYELFGWLGFVAGRIGSQGDANKARAGNVTELHDEWFPKLKIPPRKCGFRPRVSTV